MSAINHMLQSLELRGAADEAVGDLRAQVCVVPAPRPSRRPLLWAGMLVGLIAIVPWWSGMTDIRQAAVPVIRTQPAALPVSPALPEVAATSPQVEASLLPPASRLSLELGTPPSASSSAALPLPPRQAESPTAAKPEMQPPDDATEVARAPAVIPAHPLAVPSFSIPADGKLVKQMNSLQQADNEFDKAFALMQQGRMSEAEAGFVVALKLNSAHESARLAYAGLLLETKRAEAAEAVLREGLKIDPVHNGYAMTLARIELERGDATGAMTTLRAVLPYASANPDYLAFFAALLQREQRHAEAVEQYAAALRLQPQVGKWWMGLGISLQAEKRDAEARLAYQRALVSNSLHDDLRVFVEQRLKQLH
ncbi:MAG: tetratricopeptide repeat protein [Pseudomonadota bacterium]